MKNYLKTTHSKIHGRGKKRGSILILAFMVISIVMMVAASMSLKLMTSKRNTKSFDTVEQTINLAKIAADLVTVWLAEGGTPITGEVHEVFDSYGNSIGSFIIEEFEKNFYVNTAYIRALSGDVVRNVVVRVPYAGISHPLVGKTISFAGSYDVGDATNGGIENLGITEIFDTTEFEGEFNADHAKNGMSASPENEPITSVACGFEDAAAMKTYFDGFYQEVEEQGETECYIEEPQTTQLTINLDTYDSTSGNKVLVYVKPQTRDPCTVKIVGGTEQTTSQFVIINRNGPVEIEVVPSSDEDEVDTFVAAGTGSVTLQASAQFGSDPEANDSIWLISPEHVYVNTSGPKETETAAHLRMFAWANQGVHINCGNLSDADRVYFLLPLINSDMLAVGVATQKQVLLNQKEVYGNAWEEDVDF